MIEVVGLRASFGSFCLQEVNLRVEEGEYFILLGPTGAGKTLLLEAIAGLYQAEEGRIYIKGREVSGLPPERRRVGVVYQDYALFPHLTVEENIGYGLRWQGVERKRWQARVEELADFFGIRHLWGRYPKTLSGGEQQRVALARALAAGAEVLLLDEPLSALDNLTRRKLQEELRRVHRELRKTVLHITHDMEEALRLGERLGIMEGGRLVQVGPPQEVFRRPANRFVAQFVGHDNVFRGRVVAGRQGLRVRVAGLEFLVPDEGLAEGEEGFLLIPADGVVLSRKPLESSARNSFLGTVTECKMEGLVISVRLDIGIPVVARITADSASRLGVQVGERLWAVFKATSLHFFGW